MNSAKTTIETGKAVSAVPAPAAAPVAATKPVAKPTARAAAKPAKKPAAKPVAAKPVAVKPAAAKPVVAKAGSAKPAAKPTAKPAAKPSAKPTAKPAAKAPAAPKEKKVKMVRDSISIPKPEYQLLGDMKTRAGKLGVDVKKTELIRAGIKLLAALNDASFAAALRSVPSLKTGRPAKTV